MSIKPMKIKYALVTGGTSGIGKAITETLITEKYFVIVNYLDDLDARKLKEKHQNKNIDFFKADITNRKEVQKMKDYVKKKYKKIYILVNNAGVMKARSLKRMTPAEFDNVVNVNLTGTFNITKAFLDTIEENGRIINISSIAGVYGEFGLTNYAASKAGVIGFTKSLALESAKKGITVNAIAPGIIDTPLTQSLDKEAISNLKKQIPLGRLGRPEDVANAVTFLASKKAQYITRHILHVDGGLTF